jgi:hypothetical protein
MKGRFELFAGISIAAHAALFAGVAMKRGARTGETSASTSANAGTSAAVAGDTFEVPELEDVPSSEATNDETSPIELDGPNANTGAAPQANSTPSAASPLNASTHRARRASAPAPPPPPDPATYGALGDRSASDLIATFKRVFPIAASSDPLWNHVPVGFYADGDVTFMLAPDGSLTDATASANAAPAFHAAVARTTTLLRHRLFTASGATTRLHMIVRVTDKLVNHGAFTIDAAGSFELPSGRHVSVSITVR